MQYTKGKHPDAKTNDRYHVWEFDSLLEVADAAAAVEVKYASDREGKNGNFNLVNSFDEAHHLARAGWMDIRDRVDGYLEPLREKLGNLLSVKMERLLDIVGAEPDIDRFLAGELECMVDDFPLETPAEGKVFTMLVDVSMTWDNKADDIAKRGAALCALVEAYTMLGYQLELWTELTVKGSVAKEYATILTRVNNAGEPIDINCLMFACGHPDYNRRLLWAWFEGQAHTREKYGFNGGYCGYHRNGAHFMDRVHASGVVSLDGNRAMSSDPIAWVIDQLEQQGLYNESV